MIPTNVHSFSRSFAAVHGVTTATILKHIGHKVRRSRTVREGRRWHFNSAAKLQPKLPYFARATISATLKQAALHGLIEATDRYNRRKSDRTLHFAMTDEVCAAVEDDLIRFDAEVAKEVGVLASVLHFNLCHFIGIQLEQRAQNPTHAMSPATLSRLLPVSESAIKKGLAKLVTEGLIIKVGGERSRYTLPDADIELLRNDRF